uniref:broad substrate specificity ATP-binding cassette transporter ABCG2-like n=1 Tax=Ictidomys tridecemlineatus TaxID=43179 RepID=UPI000B53F1E7|nr:broad substrate specificity ATP-binding cassette transporter ABCG2-like [Ictidomys tridecemlineatus]
MASIDLNSFTQETVLSIHNICYRVKEKYGFIFCWKTFEREIFTNISGVMKPGLNAIMECTGGGKSLFLDVLAARNDPNGLSGDILINGAPRPANFKYNSGFVVQVSIASLPSRFSLLLCGKCSFTSCFIMRIVRSGEERKKTGIAMGLITDPSILFLDEPTTGLDSSTANAIVSLLKNISEQGRTIIFSFRQPQHSIFKLFDSLTILASGKLMYHGPAQKALEYFKSAGYHCEHLNNPSDFFLDVINGDSPAEVTAMQEEGGEANETEQLLIRRLPVIEGLAQFYRKSPFYRETETELERLSGGQHSRSPAFKETTYVTTFCHQFRWIFWRSFRNLMGRLKPWGVEIFIIFMLGLFIGITFLELKNDCTAIQNKAWSLYVLTVFQCVTSVSAREIFLMERNLFKLEYISGYYRVSSYFLGKLLFEFLFRRFFPSFIFTGILYWILGLKRGITAFLITTITTLMVAYSTTAMILAIGTRENAASWKTLLVIVYFVFVLVFLGMSLNFETMAPQLSWLQYVSIPHYGYMALQHNEFLEQNFCSGPNTTMSNCRPSFLICTGEEFLIIQGLNLSPWSLWINHLGLACMMFFFLAIAYLKMLFLKKHS